MVSKIASNPSKIGAIRDHTLKVSHDAPSSSSSPSTSGREPPNKKMKSTAVQTGTIAAVVTSTGMIALQVAGKAVREAVFLSVYQTVHLPHAMAAASALSLIATILWMPALTARLSPRKLMLLLFGTSGVGFVLEWLLFLASPHLGAIAIYLHTSVLAPVIITTFWSLINERFDPHTAKREVARIAGGGTLGGVLGGVMTWRASTLMSASSAVLLLAGMTFACLVAGFAIPARANEAAQSVTPQVQRDSREFRTVGALRILRDAPFLRNLAFLVAVGAIISSILDYVLGSQAVAEYGRGSSLLAFFSLFGLAVSVLSLLLQVVIGRVAIEKLSLTVHIAILPGVVMLGGAFGLAIPGLLSASILRGAEMVHRNTLFRSAYELLYTPISQAQKRATKALIDVAFDRAGMVIGSLGTMAVLYFVLPQHAQWPLLLGVVVLAFATLPIVRSLHKGYIDALEKRLYEEAESPNSRSSTSGSKTDADEPLRERLIEQVADIKPSKDDRSVAAATLANPKPALDLQAALLGSDATRAREALAKLDGLTRIGAGAAILLLAHRDLHTDAREALRRMAPLIAGQLVDALMDPNMDYPVRRRIPPILVAAPSQRAAEGLLAALRDHHFEVRYAAGRALMRMVERAEASEIALPREEITALLLDEIRHAKEMLANAKQTPTPLDDDDDNDAAAEEFREDEATEPLDVLVRDRASRSLEHIFTILAVVYGSDAMRVCFRALHQEEDRHRGTALEYLQTVIAPELRAELWPLFGEIAEEEPLPSVRSPRDVLSDLSKAIEIHGEPSPHDATKALATRSPSGTESQAP